MESYGDTSYHIKLIRPIQTKNIETYLLSDIKSFLADKSHIYWESIHSSK